MQTAALRKELQSRIDAMPEHSLYALEPLITILTEPLFTIESASADEIAMIDERMKDYEKDPSSFVPLESIQ
ncbi:MAG: hypothetical protein LBS82_02350 [Spirochaetaceae bacterium]|jgi:hypothetical protein|nr:hypothetical protein [Spirochaetaceae bacterium]